MPSRYFIGQKAERPHLIEGSTAATFADFTKQHLFPAIPVPYTRDEFHSYPEDEEGDYKGLTQNKIKSVAYAIAAELSENYRKLTNALHCNLIFLDIDDSEDAQPFAADPSILSHHLAPLAFAAYHTARSTPTFPRIRIVVAADQIPVGLYAAAVNTIAQRLGLQQITTESRVAVQPMFLPIAFRESTEHPVFAHHLTGTEFLPADIGEPDSIASAPRKGRATAPVNYDPADDLLFLRSPLEGFTLEDATDALQKIDPDCGYWEWFEIACALKHQFGDEGFDLFNEWSAKSSKYPGSDKTEAKWKSISVHPSGRAPTTARTLIYKATAAGWQGGTKVQSSLEAQLENWFNHEATEDQMLKEGPLRIAALPLPSSTQEGRFISVMMSTALERFQVRLTKGDIKKDVAEARKRLAPPVKAPKENEWPKELQGICFVSSPNLFFNHLTGEKFNRESLDNRYGRLMAKNDSGLPAIKPSEFLLHKLECQTPYDFIYDPAAGGQRYITENKRQFINLYSDSDRPKPDAEHLDYVEDILMTHLYHLIKEAECRRMVMDFLALHVQQPGRKIRFAILLQGVQGGGKGFLADAMAVVLGRANVKIVSLDAIKSNFNEWSTHTQLAVLEEIRVSGQNRHEVMNKLKPLITNDYVSIDEKYRNSRVEKNVTNYFVLTNPHDSVVVNEAERRYYVIESRLQTEEQVMELDKGDYFRNLFEIIKKPAYAAALRHLFEQWPISPDFNPDGRAPKTTYFHNLVRESANEETAALRSALADSQHPLVRSDLVGVETLRSLLEIEGVSLSNHRIGKLLRDESYVRVDQKVQVDGVRQTFFRKAGQLNGTTDIAAVVKQRAEKVKEVVV